MSERKSNSDAMNEGREWVRTHTYEELAPKLVAYRKKWGNKPAEAFRLGVVGEAANA